MARRTTAVVDLPTVLRTPPELVDREWRRCLPHLLWSGLPVTAHLPSSPGIGSRPREGGLGGSAVTAGGHPELLLTESRPTRPRVSATPTFLLGGGTSFPYARRAHRPSESEPPTCCAPFQAGPRVPAVVSVHHGGRSRFLVPTTRSRSEHGGLCLWHGAETEDQGSFRA